MKRKLVALLTGLGVTVVLTTVTIAQEGSPQKSGLAAQNSVKRSAPASAETAVKLTDGFGETYTLIRQGDGSYEGVVFGIELWVVAGRISANDYELHTVNPNTAPGDCGSFVWEGTRSGGALTGRLFHEATTFNSTAGCALDVSVNGSLTVIMP